MSNDIDELTALNRDYVASVQNSDVKRFDEILAADFYCSNPDKSLVDRAAFLKQTAVPVTIKNLTRTRREDPRARRLRHHPRRHELHHAPTASRPMAATPIAGRSRTASGSRSRRMCRGRRQRLVIAGLVPAIQSHFADVRCTGSSAMTGSRSAG